MNRKELLEKRADLKKEQSDSFPDDDLAGDIMVSMLLDRINSCMSKTKT